MIDPPMTLEEALAYRYFKWAGEPEGTKYDPGRCAYEIWVPGRAVRAHQCLHPNGHGPDALYCRRHAKMVDRRRFPS